jgi:hypothetical protein
MVRAAGIAQTGPDGQVERDPDEISLGPGFSESRLAAWSAAWRDALVDCRFDWTHGAFPPDARFSYPRSWWGAVSLALPDTVKIQNIHCRYSPQSILALLATLPFTVAAAGDHDESWWNQPGRTHLRNSFSDGHFLHGWMAAFSGDDGHARIASRRWLQHGPWRVLRDEEHDVTMVQLYDLAADEETAWAQYLPGNDRLGFSERGAFVSRRTTFEHIKPSHYDRSSRTSIVLVNDREPGFGEIRHATAIKLLQPYKDARVDQVAFVFMQETTARKWLPELWLRGLECRAIVSGREVVLTDGYEPPPHEPPEWVERLQDREGR